MQKKLTHRQERIYKFICNQIQEVGYPPTVREIAAEFEISEKGAHDHLCAIEKKDYIRRAPGKPRAIEVMEFLSKGPVKSIEVPIVVGLRPVRHFSHRRTLMELCRCRTIWQMAIHALLCASKVRV